MTRELRDEYFFSQDFFVLRRGAGNIWRLLAIPGAAGFVCFVSKIQRVREKVKPH